MKALLQRVAQARVVIAGETVGEIGQGLLVLVCAERGDSEVQAAKLLAKILKLRIFSDGPGAGPPQARPDPSGGSVLPEVKSVGATAACAGPPQARPAPSGGSVLHEVKSVGARQPGKMNRSVQDMDGQGACGGLLIVTQFTLAADVSGGNRPSFTGAAPPELAQRLYDDFVARARAAHPKVATGQFAADMQVHLVNDGPVTIALQVT